jgi:hypothetical protein
LRLLRAWYAAHPYVAAVVPTREQVLLSELPEAMDAGGTNAAAAYRPRLTTGDLALLIEFLPTARLSGLDARDNLMLLAVVEAVASLYGAQQAEAATLDPAGTQFLMAVKLYQVCRRCLAPADRPTALPWADCLWALHSDSQDTLVRLCVPANVSEVQGLRPPHVSAAAQCLLVAHELTCTPSPAASFCRCS